ncbi:tRNA (N6-threonylcarbamoyladenosine(37)-N6)-methyltransferase TrmO [Nocardia tengchongensis]|uniref:tRNA (N6-threonylcarbamoyladenosine(37)-N6)-methyltransferase TrmO n=1 Tax=Nocardia tengchongensis TaxID=2055889 RepID=UPI0036807855
MSSEISSTPAHFEVRAVGLVRSPLTDRAGAPRQADEDAPPAEIVLAPEYAAAAADLQPGMRVVLLTWLHAGSRDVLAVHPRGDRSRTPTGVFATRSPDRPNPIGLHEVTLTAVSPEVLGVAGLEAIDGTPILDIKPVLGSIETR